MTSSLKPGSRSKEEDTARDNSLLTPLHREADWSPTCRGVQGGHLPSSGKATIRPVYGDSTSVKAEGDTTLHAMILSTRRQECGDKKEYGTTNGKRKKIICNGSDQSQPLVREKNGKQGLLLDNTD